MAIDRTQAYVVLRNLFSFIVPYLQPYLGYWVQPLGTGLAVGAGMFAAGMLRK